MKEAQLQPHKIRSPIQLLAVWFAVLVLLDGSLLTAAGYIEQPIWVAPMLAIAAIAFIPTFLVLAFVMLTKFRPHLQDDEHYSEWLQRKENAAAWVEDDKGQTDAKDDSRYVEKGEVYLSFLRTSDIAKLFACFLLRSHQLKRALSIDQFTPIVDPLLKMPTSEVETYVLGILQGMFCGLEQYLEIVDQKNVRLKELPEGFETHMEIVVSGMKNRHRDIEVYLNKIDAIQ